MRRLNFILSDYEYQDIQRQIDALESDRNFCRHNQEHCYEVARIAIILAKREGLMLNNEIIYATAMLHDIGRAKQYTSGVKHNVASAEIADRILSRAGYREEKMAILTAIDNHCEGDKSPLAKILHRADKLSRACYNCQVRAECYWAEADKNIEKFRENYEDRQ